MTAAPDKARVMIVEDESIIAGEIRMILDKFGYQVTSVAATGQAAIEQAESDLPDLILMDINLKGDMDGIAAAGIIRDRLDIPVIYLTASVEESKLERAKRTVPAGYVLKPFSEDDIRVALEIGLYVAETGRKIADSQKRLAAAERIAGFGSCEMEIESGRCVWSDEFFRISGYEPGAFEPDADMNVRIIHPEDRERVVRLLREAIETGREYDIEKRLVHPDGTIRYVHSLGSVIRDAAGRPVRIIRTIRDITEKKLLERQNRLNRLRLEIISEIAMLPEAGEKEICDLVLERMLALSGSRIGYLGFMSADETTMVIHAWSQSAMADCEVADNSIRFSIDKAGLWGEPVRRRGPILVNDYSAYHEAKKGFPPGHVPVERFLSVPVFDQGRVVALAAVGNKTHAYTPDDVTQLSLLMQGIWEQIRRKRMEKAIVESEEKYRSLISNIPDVTWTSDAGGNTVFISDNIETVYGFTAEEIYGAGPDLWLERIHPQDVAGVKNAYEELFEKKANFDIEYRIQREDGLWIWLHDRAIAVYERNGVKYADGIFSDITGRKHMEEALRKTNRLLDSVRQAQTRYISQEDTRPVFDDLLATLVEMTESEFGFLDEVLFDAGGTPYKLSLAMSNIAWDHEAERLYARLRAQNLEFRNLNNLAGLPVLRRLPVIANDAARDRHAGGLPSGHPRIRTFMGLPVFAGGEIVGVIGVANRDDGYDASLADFLEPYLNACGSIIQAIRMRSREHEAFSALQQSEHRFNSMFEHMASGAAVYQVIENGDDFVFRAFNRAAEKITNRSRTEVVGKRLSEMFPNMPESALPAALKRVWETGEALYLPPFYYADSRVRGWRENRLYKLPSDEVVALFDDVTERMQIQIERERLLTAIEHTADAIVVTDPEGNIQFVNYAFETITGYSREEAVGQNPRILRSGRQSRPFYEKLWATISGGEVFHDLLINRRKDGTLYTEEMIISPVYNNSGQLMNYVAVKRDITERQRTEEALKKSEEQLRQSQKMESIGTLAGGIAHDFNNILYPIIGHSEMLIDDLEGDARLRDRVRTILTSALRAADLVRQILSFSRQSQKEKTAVKIQDVIREVLLLIRHSLPALININLIIDDSCKPVMADAGQIHQVIMNLITNAAHAMEGAPGTLEIGLSEMGITGDTLPSPGLPPGKYVDLLVSDTGRGMDEAVMSRIFDPFFTTKEVGKGSGLGLSVSYGIVKQHGGIIRVESRPGRGSVFHVYLPVAGNMSTEQGDAAALSPGNGAEHILFVDDDEYIIDLVGPMLKRQGYRVTSGIGAPEALEIFRTDPGRYDLVVTDMSMPSMTGVQLIDELRAIRPDLPAILCTGFSEQIDEDKARALGINAFLMKPVARDQLIAAVRRVLDENA